MRKLRVGYVVGALDVGGSERQLFELAARLDRERFEASICCLARDGAQASAARQAGIPVRVLGVGPLRHLKWVRWVSRMRRLFRESRLDVVHAFLFPSYALAALASHGLPTRVVAGIRSAGAGPEGRWPFSALERAGLRRAACIVVNANAVHAAVSRRHPGLITRIETIPNGIDLGAYEVSDRSAVRAELGVAPEAGLVLMVANLIAYKGHDDALRAFARLRSKLGGARLALAGAGPEEARLRRRIRDLGLDDSVLVLGRRSDVPRLLGAADVALLASHVEGMPNAVMEASAAGRPVVATRVGGVAELVRDGVTGLLIEAGDVEGMADALQRAMDPTLGARLGAAGRALMREGFSWPRVVASHEALYSSLADSLSVEAGRLSAADAR